MASRYRGKKGKKTNYIKYCLVAGLVLVSVLAGYLAYKHYGFARFFHPDVTLGEKYSVRGIDVSNHNGKVNFDKVAAAGYSFVYVKASEGATYKDARFKANCNKAARSGLKVGAYHFFRNNRDGLSQARNFIDQVRAVDLDLPLVIDIEDAGNDNSVETALVHSRLRQMAAELKRAGYKIMIYTNGDGFKKYYQPCFKGEPLWLCTFNDPDSVKGKGHVMQQYCHWGRVPGVSGEVDLNVYMGTQRQWVDWLEDIK
ncbi:glycoside hydrolase family 25 protein [Sodaliphilus sp.]|uniref:glycoside hydrolase family 25 protein n=1 Tax=Sodaliphilus sp. TaxID=2815818 RepID=UPI00388EA710